VSPFVNASTVQGEHMKDMRHFAIGIGLVGVIAAATGWTTFVPAAIAQGKDPLAGAWEQTSVKNLSTGEVAELLKPPLHLIYADGYYVQFTASGDRQKLDVAPGKTADLTKEQLVDRLRMQGQYGTYKVLGQKVTRHVVSAAAPTNEGRDTTSDFQIKGDELIVTAANPQGQKTESHFKRLR